MNPGLTLTFYPSRGLTDGRRFAAPIGVQSNLPLTDSLSGLLQWFRGDEILIQRVKPIRIMHFGLLGGWTFVSILVSGYLYYRTLNWWPAKYTLRIYYWIAYENKFSHTKRLHTLVHTLLLSLIYRLDHIRPYIDNIRSYWIGNSKAPPNLTAFRATLKMAFSVSITTRLQKRLCSIFDWNRVSI